MDFEILPAKLSDVAALNELVNSAYRGEGSKAGWTTEADLLDGTRTEESLIEETLNRPGTTILRYVEDEKLIGCMEVRNDGDKLYLGMLTVRPNLQGKGIGNKLLKAAELEARKQGLKKIYMSVISKRKELLDWYIRHGYEVTGTKPFILPDTRFGVPKMELEFLILEKPID